MSKLEFKPEDFAEFYQAGSIDAGGPRDKAIVGLGRMFAETAARIANARLAEMLAQAPAVFCRDSFSSANPCGNDWVSYCQPRYHTHRARVVNIEVLKP